MATFLSEGEFSPVWLSTEEQLRRLADVFTQASFVEKTLGRYRVPPGTAHARGLFMSWMRVPIVYVAQGRLTITNTALRFRATPPQMVGWQVLEVDSTLTFELTPKDIQSVEPFTFPSPVGRLFDLSFTRIRTTKPGLAPDFLICVGGRVRIPRIRARSLELRAGIESFRQAALSDRTPDALR
jgi:hypothetical protein